MFESHAIRMGAPGFGLGAYPLRHLCQRGVIAPVHAFDTLTVDWDAAGSFVSVSQVVALTQVLLWAESQQCSTTLGNVPAAVETYISRMNAYQLLGIAHVERFTRHSPGARFLPMGRVTDSLDAWHMADRMTDVLTSHLNVDQTVRETLDLAFGEVMDNIIQHAESPIGGIAAAQYYPATATLEVCVSDCGQGIAASMANNARYRGMADAKLLALSLRDGQGEGVAVGFGGKGAGGGMGLAITRRLASTLGGNLWITSVNQHVATGAWGTGTRGNVFFPGTVLVMKLPMTPGMSVRASDILPGMPALPATWGVGEGIGTTVPTNDGDPTNDGSNVLW